VDKVDNRKGFSQELSEIHAPQSLINDTIKLVQEENDRLAGAEAQRTTPSQHGKIVAFPSMRWATGVAAAACAVLLIAGGRMMLTGNDPIRMGSINLTQVPEISFTVKGDSAAYTPEDFANQYGVDFSQAIEGHSLEAASAGQGVNAMGQVLSMVNACYLKEDARLDVIAADFETPIFTAMQTLTPVQIADTEARLAVDTETGTLYAAWKTGDVFFVAYGDDHTQEEFVKLIEDSIRQ